MTVDPLRAQPCLTGMEAVSRNPAFLNFLPYVKALDLPFNCGAFKPGARVWSLERSNYLDRLFSTSDNLLSFF